MLMTLLDPRPSGLRIAATTAAILMACATSTELRGEEHAASPPRAAPSDEAEKGQRGGGDRWGPQLGVIVAPSPSGSPLVLRVRRGSPASQAGIRHGDFILSVDGEKIESPEQLRKSLKGKDAGKANITIWRNGEEQSHEIDLASQERSRETRFARRAWLGAMIRDSGEVGVEIARIYLNSPADKAGLKVGDRITQIDGALASSPQVVTQRIADLEPGAEVEIVVNRDGEVMTIDVEVGNLEDFHERLFGKRFRRKFDDFHEMFDPDFDGVPERVFSFRIPTGDDDEVSLHDLLREMREELREFRQEFRKSNGKDRESSDRKDAEHES